MQKGNKVSQDFFFAAKSFNRFAYLCLHNVKNVLEPTLVRSLFPISFVEALKIHKSKASRTLFPIPISTHST